MGIYIPGMKMPTNDNMFPTALWVYPNGYAVVFNDYEKMQKYTYAFPVPPHGRLGDLDALEKEAQKRMLICNKNDNQFQKSYEIMRAIALAPTIIPADGKDTDVTT